MVLYFVEKGKLLLEVNGETEEIKEPAILYDKKANLLLKHGEKDKILGYYNTIAAETQKISSPAISKEFATEFLEDCCMRTFEKVPKKLVAEFLNEAISTTGVIDKQLAKLEKQVREYGQEKE